MLLEPQLLVLDRLFEDLGFEERRAIAGWHRAPSAARYPLRRMLYVGFTEAAPGLRSFVPLDAMDHDGESEMTRKTRSAAQPAQRGGVRAAGAGRHGRRSAR